MDAYICGIGWVTGAGFGWGSQGGEWTMPDLPLPPLTRKDVFPEPNQRFGRMSEYTKLGLAAVTFALRDAGLEKWADKRPIGVVASTRLGCLATDLEYHTTVLLDGGGLASPNLFAYTLANCFLGDAAIQFGLTGSSFAINETGGDNLDAIRMALEDLEQGEADTMLAGICDLAVPEAFADSVSLTPGAVFLVLAATAPAASNNYGIVSLVGDGTLLHNGSATNSLFELVQRAMTGIIR
ncbi:MAG: beta-ketoacyl synthase N-terminal-like domain-containing protein [Desulfuromonadaceae bacterium]|nr:beta-ketoacyl synthase N-terminal-like domain-containing protein [Desulfuromonadaceae bacterium]